MGHRSERPRLLQPWHWMALSAVVVLVIGTGVVLARPSLIGLGSQSRTNTAPVPEAKLGAGVTATSASPSFLGASLSLPLRAAYYRADYPQAWSTTSGQAPLVVAPAAGRYDGASAPVVDRHISDLQYAGMQAGIVPWNGPDTPADQHLPLLLQRAAAAKFHWAISYEREVAGNPGPDEVKADLAHLATVMADPSYLHIGGRAVLLVRTAAADGCQALDRWAGVDLTGIHLAVQTVTGYATCSHQPQSWYGYNPVAPRVLVAGRVATVSPGFAAAGQSTRLARDPKRFRSDVSLLATGKAPLQLITSYNDWLQGTAVETAPQWTSPSKRGIYLDILHDVLKLGHTTAKPTTTATSSAPAPAPDGSRTTVTVAAVGDMACDPSDDNWNGGAGTGRFCHERAVAALIGQLHPAALLALGDTQYENGTSSAFAKSYAPTYGRYLSITRPVVGNHEYRVGGAAGYFDYFGARAGPPGKGYYSYDLGAWHLIALNSECGKVSCSKGSAQETWLKQDLAAHANACVLAYWHVPRWSNGAEHGDSGSVSAFVQDLYDAKAEIILTGHDHDYERFAPRAPSGKVDRASGIREFVVGTGGKNLKPVSPSSATEAHNDKDYGLLSLTLSPNAYSWRFLSEAGGSYTDSGTTSCH